MEVVYYLFGLDVSSAYCDEHFDVVLNKIRAGEYDYEVYRYDPKTEHPSYLLEHFNGWCGYVEITKEEYNAIELKEKVKEFVAKLN